ncbi:MAG: fasciclin domain-containing protein [Chlamydiia bacterium]|nr:fasciclin domain-containing protein [Chlamydiia bacterium]
MKIGYFFAAITMLTASVTSLEGGHDYGNGMKMHDINAKQNIVNLAVQSDQLSTLVAALQAADLVSTLEAAGPYTVFAPTNQAFANLGNTLDDFLKPENKDKLREILLFHVVPGKVMSGDLKSMPVDTAAGKSINVNVMNDKVMINGATVIQADIDASNGVVHIIDKVLIP